MLKDTIDLMTSDDHQDRLKAEYWQTRVRHDRLHEIIVKYSANTLEFTPESPLELLEIQSTAMMNYLKALEIRAEIEGIDLYDV